ncbi:MAG: hypothetical protein AAF567_19030 [Actinomycetota bacterium]
MVAVIKALVRRAFLDVIENPRVERFLTQVLFRLALSITPDGSRLRNEVPADTREALDRLRGALVASPGRLALYGVTVAFVYALETLDGQGIRHATAGVVAGLLVVLFSRRPSRLRSVALCAGIAVYFGTAFVEPQQADWPASVTVGVLLTAGGAIALLGILVVALGRQPGWRVIGAGACILGLGDVLMVAHGVSGPILGFVWLGSAADVALGATAISLGIRLLAFPHFPERVVAS